MFPNDSKTIGLQKINFMAFSWHGVFPALLTPFTANDEPDLDLFGKNLDAQLDAGVDGIILGGTLGEASTLQTEEKKQLVEYSLKKLGGKIPVVMNIAESSAREALNQVKNAEKWGVQGLMALPPMRYKSDEGETIAWFTMIANATSLPVMIYNNPVDYKIEVTPDMFAELAVCENITAIKESTRDVTNVTRMRNRFGDRFKLLCGVDTLAMEELCLGADGWVAGLVDAFPHETVAIYRLVKAGKIAEATSIYRWFMPLLELDIHPKLVQYIKLAATATGIGSEYVRAPRLPITGVERQQVMAVINEGIRTRPELPDYLSL